MKAINEDLVIKYINKLADLDLEILLTKQGKNKKLEEKLKKERKKFEKKLDEMGER